MWSARRSQGCTRQLADEAVHEARRAELSSRASSWAVKQHGLQALRYLG